MTNQQDQIIDEAINQLANRCLLVNLRCRHWTGKATDRRVAAHVEKTESAAEGTTRVTKTLVDDKYLKAIMKHVTAGRRLLEENTSPWSAAGGRIAPAERLPIFLTEFGKIQAKFDAAVQKLCDDYHILKHRASLSLGSMYDEDLYPSAADLQDRFSMDLSVSEVPVSTDFRFQIPDEIKEDLRIRLRDSVANAVDDVKQDLAKRMLRPLTNLQEKLDSEGMKKFSPSLIDNVIAMADLAEQLNVFNDPTIRPLASKMRGLAVNIDREGCRTDDKLRKQTADKVRKGVADLGIFDLL